MLIDANILLFASDQSSPHHDRAQRWLEDSLNGERRVGIPWESLGAFIRVSTNPRASREPLSPEQAWTCVNDWLAAPRVWIPAATADHAVVFGGLVAKYRISGNLVPDAHFAAIAIEHGLEVCSADTDFARFTEIRWRNPLSEGAKRQRVKA